MRTSTNIASGFILSMTLWSVSWTAAPAAVENDCQTAGSEVSALIDREATSPNIASARAVFQHGIMNCMEGDTAEANTLYQEAKRLLGSAPSPMPEKAPAAPAAVTVAATAENDCQKVGGGVSALIDKEIASPNVSSARAVFQRGIMECMEGDTMEANRLYQEARKFLSSDR
jgi:heme oxygenase